ncbi:MAG: XRE family transcriptional regulator [Candidatus Viridilinea halotolerans]|uniref:XRE family transcriptional regulator n=1 Tax=Candidatus Viridilinea halotolerans TaxID=2491704 RepID=A0A426U1A2_9CHLR|nr:MAG: XRE family transcriptional regulator [Candidatus Viridilinea halotolerans]
MSLEQFIEHLQASVSDLAAEEIADTLYLVLHLTPRHEVDRGAEVDLSTHDANTPEPPFGATTEYAAQHEDAALAQHESDPTPVSQEDEESRSTASSDSPARPSDAAANLYADGCSQGATASLSFRTPHAPPLVEQAAIARSLRLLLMRIPSRRMQELDEPMTVRQIADTRLWLPVLRRRVEPRFRVALLFDDTPSMAIWHSSMHALVHILERHSAMRSPLIYRLNFGAEEALLRPGLSGTSRDYRAESALRDPTGNTLILLVSDGVGPHWRDGRMAAALTTWGQHSLVSMLQVLPPNLWERSSLGAWPAARVVASQPGVANRHLKVQHRRGRRNQPPNNAIALPVFRFNAADIAQWCQLATGAPHTSATAYSIQRGADPRMAHQRATPQTAEVIVERFMSSASAPAQQLGALLAVTAPLNLAIARLVQRALLPESDSTHLAEVWLSGLLQRPADAGAPTNDPEEIVYDFQAGVRERLRGYIPATDALAVLRTVSAYIGTRLGQPHDFRAWFNDGSPLAADDPRRPFAAVAAEVLYGFGGAYRELAERLMRGEGGSGLAGMDEPETGASDNLPKERDTSARSTMKSGSRETFGRLLKVAINSIATCEGKTTSIIEEELAEQVGLAGSTLRRYKSGYLPPDPRTIEVIAEASILRGFLSRKWLEHFLHAARYPQADRLLKQLYQDPQVRPRPPRIYENLPAPSYNQFVMRDQVFADVLDGLQQRSSVVLIIGMGGSGKTALAREVADTCLRGDATHPRDDALYPPFDAAVWISDKDYPGTTNLSVILDTVARTLDYPGFTQFAHSEKQHEVEQLLRRQRVLLVVDNFETITDSALLTWLHRLPEPSKALVTTREYGREWRSSWPVEMRGMNEAEAWALVEQRLRQLRIEHLVSTRQQLEPLLIATGGNPKAITSALGLVKHERLSLQQVVDDLYAARGDLFKDLFERAWNLLDEAARRVLMVATLFPTNASGDALSVSADVQGFVFDRAVERLSDMSLIDEQRLDLSNPPRYALHPLVRAFTKDKLRLNTTFEIEARKRMGD